MGSMVFVGVGPGDSELITLKAIVALESADLVALPDAGSGEGAAEKIASRWISGKRILRLPMPMMGAREDWVAAHQQAANALIERLGQGLSIAYPVLGDPLLYATSGYLLKLIAPHHACEVIPGIPALCAMAARLQIPLAESREPLTVLPGYDSDDTELPRGNVVVMKAGRQLAALRDALLKSGRPAWVTQNLGMDDEVIAPISEAKVEGKQSYFTTVLVKPSREGGAP